MPKFNERLRLLRRKKNLSQQEFADQLKLIMDDPKGCSKSSINMYERGEREPSIETLEAIADYFNVDMDYLMGRSDIELAHPVSIYFEDTSANATTIDFSKYHQIPILGRIAAGLPVYAEENIEGYTLTDLNGGAEYFGLRVSGDSMNALRIHDGDIIIVRRQNEVENGEIAVVMVDDDEATVKRFYRFNTAVTLVPQSTNSVHHPQTYDISETNIRILGKVIKVEFSI